MTTSPSDPVHAAHYADQASFVRTTVIENVSLARDTFRIRLECARIAERIVPGQFVMLRLPGGTDPLLGRPMAFYDTVLAARGAAVGIDVVYLAVGRMTSRLASLRPGAKIEIWGPLGNGFGRQPTQHLVMVAGGIGQTPLLALSQERLGIRTYGDPPRDVPRAERVTLCYGVRTRNLLAGVEDFERAGVRVCVSSDDGTVGYHGLVTDLLRRELDNASGPCRVVCCGPGAMMAAVAEWTSKAGVPCEVSLETPMACGTGICFSCVTRVRQEGGDWDYKRTCVEGPVFDAAKIVW